MMDNLFVCLFVCLSGLVCEDARDKPVNLSKLIQVAYAYLALG